MRVCFLMLLLPLVCACASRNDRFEDAWLGNCYLDNVNHLVMGDPLPGSPGQFYSDEWEDSMYPKSRAFTTEINAYR